MVVPLRLPADTLPVTVNEDSVPTVVRLGCAAVDKVPAIEAAVRFTTAASPVNDRCVPVKAVAVTFPAATLPATSKRVVGLSVPIPTIP